MLERQLAGVKRAAVQLRRDGERLTKEVENPLLASPPRAPRRKPKSTPKKP